MDYSVSVLHAFFLLPNIADLAEDGNIGVIQTMVGELVKKPEHERKTTLPFPVMTCGVDGSSPSVRGDAVRVEHRHYHRAGHRRYHGETGGIDARHIFL